MSLAAIILFCIFYAHVSHAKLESVRHWGRGVLFYLVSLAAIILFYIFYAHVSLDLKVGRGVCVQSMLSWKV